MQGWVRKCSSVHTNFFQACTDGVWQTPSGVRPTSDSTSLYYCRLWQTLIMRCKISFRFLPGFFSRLLSFVHFSGFISSVWQPLSKGKKPDFTQSIGPLGVRRGVSRTSEQRFHINIGNTFKAFQGSATGYTALNNILNADTEFSIRFPIL